MFKKLVPLVLLAAVMTGCPKNDPGKTDNNSSASTAPVAAASTAPSADASSGTTTTTTTTTTSSSAKPAGADDHDLSIKNNTGSELKSVYYKRSNDAKDTWNVMAGDAGDVVWAKGEEAPVRLDQKYDQDCDMDIKVVTKNGDEWTCGPVVLCNKKGDAVKKKIELTMTNGTLTWDAVKE